MLKNWLPRTTRIAPKLDPARESGPVRRRYALLINLFYSKDPHATFGKQVLSESVEINLSKKMRLQVNE